MDFDWYGNTAPISHLIDGKRTQKNLTIVKYETTLRQHNQTSNFKAKTPWANSALERSLDRMTPIDHDTHKEAGFQHNAHYSSVEVIDRTKEIRDKLPDHLTLPTYTDKFVAKNNAKFMSLMAMESSKGKRNLNDLKFFASLRSKKKKKLGKSNLDKA